MVRLASRPARTLTLVAVAAAIAGAGLVSAGPASAVANGEPVPNGRYRFAAKLTMTDIPGPFGLRFTSYCSGALVAPSWVITAGHCFVDRSGARVSGPVPYPTKVAVARGEPAGSGEDRHVVAVTEVRQAPGTDIALVRLTRPVSDVTPLALADQAPQVGMTVRIAGWGATSSLIPLPAVRLQTGLMTVSSVTSTTVGVKGLRPSPTTSACLYDSGAPYFTTLPGAPRLVSVESDGPPCPHDHEETTARVDTVASWIHGTIGA